MGSCIKCSGVCDDKYKYCQSCAMSWKAQQSVNSGVINQTGVSSVPVRVEKKWDENPVVDALLKINNNLSSMKRSLESIEKSLKRDDGDLHE